MYVTGLSADEKAGETKEQGHCFTDIHCFLTFSLAPASGLYLPHP